MIHTVREYLYNNRAYLIVLLSFLIIAIVTILHENGESKKILKYGVFVVGKIVNIRRQRGTSIEYEYYFAKKKFHSSEGMHVNSEYVGAKYLVKINPRSPYESRLLKDYFVDDSIFLRQPDSGWVINPIRKQ